MINLEGTESLEEIEELERLEQEKTGLLKKEVMEILKAHNIKIGIFGCGCCGSPQVSFEKDGVKIVDDVPYFDIDMFKEDI